MGRIPAMNEEEKTKKVLEELLEPFGIEVEVWGNASNHYFPIFLEKDGKQIGIRRENDSFQQWSWRSMEDLKDILFNGSSFVKDYGFHRAHPDFYVQNPFFKCRSLEEALIKKDLLENVSV